MQDLDKYLDAGIRAIKDAKKFGVTITEFIIIGVVYKFKAISINAISDYTSLNRTTVSKAIKKMATKGILEVTTNPNNRSQRLVKLS